MSEWVCEGEGTLLHRGRASERASWSSGERKQMPARGVNADQSRVAQGRLKAYRRCLRFQNSRAEWVSAMRTVGKSGASATPRFSGAAYRFGNGVEWHYSYTTCTSWGKEVRDMSSGCTALCI